MKFQIGELIKIRLAPYQREDLINKFAVVTRVTSGVIDRHSIYQVVVQGRPGETFFIQEQDMEKAE
jgi:hypothetical protein